MKPNAAFRTLLALALGGAGLLVAAAIRFLRAGIPADGHEARTVTWHGILIPGTGDVYIHLVSYLLLALLLCGSLPATWLAAVRLRRTRRFVAACLASPGPQTALLARLGARIGLADRIDLIASSRPLAFCYGLRRPRIGVTTGLLAVLDEQELEAVLRHEAYHVANRDPLRLLVASVLASAFFFLPLLAMLRDHFAVAAELAADRHAARGKGKERSLAAALCKLLARPEATAPDATVGAATALTLRVDALLGEAVPPRHHIRADGVLWTAIGVGLLILLLIVPLPYFAGNGIAFHGPLTSIFC